jgi:hypothetical protein
LALDRIDLYVSPQTAKPYQLVVGRDASFGFVVLNRNGTLRDLTNDILAVAAKAANGDTLVYTFTADPNQATTGKGKCTLTCPAAQHTSGRVGIATIDLLINNRLPHPGAFKITLATSEAA